MIAQFFEGLSVVGNPYLHFQTPRCMRVKICLIRLSFIGIIFIITSYF